LKENKIWNGVTLFCGKMPYFRVDPNTDVSTGNYYYDNNGFLYKQVNSICWFTNLDHSKRHEKIDLYKHYNPEEYPKYDNYDAIEVSKTCEIPMDYDGIMGVPITFLDKYCPEQFEIVDINPHFFFSDVKIKQLTLHNVNRKDPYSRILIKKI
jgi:hypothetical protein